MTLEADGALVGVIGDEDTVTGFVLAGVGDVDERRRRNFLVVDDDTTEAAIREKFNARGDVAVVLVSQHVADRVRPLLDARAASGATVPAVLEIPSKDAPYDATRDAVLSRAQRALGRGDEDEELRG
tara:strand:+ start:1582 stop:1962 length:381 start_codon:yes stop_codon:yes gene_type:complete